jgi:hypothetical protein
MDDKIYNEPSDVDAQDGTVIVDGPDGVAVSLTPDAALETGGRLIDAAALARGQEMARPRHRKKPGPEPL